MPSESLRALARNDRGAITIEMVIIIGITLAIITTGVYHLSRSVNLAADCQATDILSLGTKGTRPCGRSAATPPPAPAVPVCDGITCMCFVAGTPVQTIDGPQAIETIKPGTLVLARDQYGDAIGWKPVLEHLITRTNRLVRLTISSETGAIDKLDVTPNHPLYTLNRGWVETGDLVPNEDVLVDQSNRPVRVVAAELREADETVYNLNVADFHTYYAGHIAIWAHNQGGGPCSGGNSPTDNPVWNPDPNLAVNVVTAGPSGSGNAPTTTTPRPNGMQFGPNGIAPPQPPTPTPALTSDPAAGEHGNLPPARPALVNVSAANAAHGAAPLPPHVPIPPLTHAENAQVLDFLKNRVERPDPRPSLQDAPNDYFGYNDWKAQQVAAANAQKQALGGWKFPRPAAQPPADPGPSAGPTPGPSTAAPTDGAPATIEIPDLGSFGAGPSNFGRWFDESPNAFGYGAPTPPSGSPAGTVTGAAPGTPPTQIHIPDLDTGGSYRPFNFGGFGQTPSHFGSPPPSPTQAGPSTGFIRPNNGQPPRRRYKVKIRRPPVDTTKR